MLSYLPSTSTDYLILIINFFIAITVLKIIYMIYKLSRNKLNGISTKPLSKPGTGGKRILIIGDSTAVGTGASDPADSIGGRLSKDYPDAEIINKADNGGLIRDLENQIADIKNEKFDFIIISVGGNDVWHLTRLSSIKKHLYTVLPKIVYMNSGEVFFLIYNNIGAAPIFPKALGGFLRWRCNRIQAVIKEVTHYFSIPTIELFNEDRENPFISNPEELFSADGIHPSSVGYKLWYHRMWKKIVRGEHLKD